MSKTTMSAIIVLVILIIGGAYAATHKSKTNNNSATNSSTQNQSTTSSSASATGSIDIKNMMFTPSQITVAKGGSVTWTNNDSTTHTVVDDLSNVGGPASGNIAPGSTYSFTFTKTGSFQYHCSIHPSMRGTIVVK
jgi:plastocyanin